MDQLNLSFDLPSRTMEKDNLYAVYGRSLTVANTFVGNSGSLTRMIGMLKDIQIDNIENESIDNIIDSIIDSYLIEFIDMLPEVFKSKDEAVNKMKAAISSVNAIRQLSGKVLAAGSEPEITDLVSEIRSHVLKIGSANAIVMVLTILFNKDYEDLPAADKFNSYHEILADWVTN